MSRFLDFGSVLGGESLETPETVDGAVYQEAVQDAQIAEVEKDMAEVEADIQEVEAQIETVEDAVEDVQEDVAELKEMIEGNESWNPGKASYIYGKLVKKVNAFQVPGFENLELAGQESFADASTAQIALMGGLESIGEKMKKVGGAIKTFFVNLYNSFIAWFRGLFDRYKGLEAKANNLKTRVQSTADDKIKKEIKLGKWNVYLNVDKRKTTEGKEIDMLAGAVQAACEELGAMLLSGSADAEHVEKALNRFLAEADEKSSGESNANTSTIKGKIGGMAITVVIPKKGTEDLAGALKAANVSYKATGEGSKIDGTVASSVGKAGLVKICDNVASGAKKLQLAKFDNKALTTARDKAIAVAEQAEASTADEKDNKKKGVAVIRNGHNSALRISKQMQSLAGDTLAASLAWVGAHI